MPSPALVLAILAFAAVSANEPEGQFLLDLCEPEWKSEKVFGRSLNLAFDGVSESVGRTWKEGSVQTKLLAPISSPESKATLFQVRQVVMDGARKQTETLRRLRNAIEYSLQSQVRSEVEHLSLQHCFYVGEPLFDGPLRVFLVTEPFEGSMESSAKEEPKLSEKFSRRKAVNDRLGSYLDLARELLHLHQQGFVSNQICPQRVVFLDHDLKEVRLNSLWELQRVGERVTSFVPDHSDADTELGSEATPLNDIWAFGMLIAELETRSSIIVGNEQPKELQKRTSRVVDPINLTQEELESLIRGEDDRDVRPWSGGQPGAPDRDEDALPKRQVRKFWVKNIMDNFDRLVFSVPPHCELKELVRRMIEPRRTDRIQEMATVVRWLELLLNRTKAQPKDWNDFHRDYLGVVNMGGQMA